MSEFNENEKSQKLKIKQTQYIEGGLVI